MKSSKEFFRLLRPGDFFAVGVTVLLSLVLFLSSFFTGEKLTAEIYVDGELYEVCDLSSLTESRVTEVKSCRILLEKDAAAFLSSGCPDGLCVRRGRLTRSGDTMACVPERVTVVLKGAKDSGVDAVVF